MKIIKVGRIPQQTWWIGNIVKCAFCGQKAILEKDDKWRVEEYTLQSLKGRATFVIKIKCQTCHSLIFFRHRPPVRRCKREKHNALRRRAGEKFQISE